MANVIQAPDMLQNMIAPDIATQQMQLQRQQQLADMLRQQANTPLESQTVTGSGPARVVPISPWQGLAKMLQAGIGGYMQHNIDEKSLSLNKDMAARYAAALEAGNGSGKQTQPVQQPAPQSAPMPSQAAPSDPTSIYGVPSGTDQSYTPISEPLTSMMAPGQAAPAPLGSAPAPVAPVAQPQPSGAHPNQFALARLLQGALIGRLGGDQAASAYWDNAKLPEAVKTNGYYGLKDADVAAAMERKNAAEGQTLVRNDSTLTRTEPNGAITPLFTAPNPHLGTNITWQNGKPVATEIPGVATIKSAMAAAEKQGTNRETVAPKEILPTNTDGTVNPVTIDQTIHPANAGFPPGTVLPSPTPGVQDRSVVLQDERAKILARPDSDPGKSVDLDAINREIARLPASESTPRGVGAPYGQKEGMERLATDNAATWSSQKARAAQAAGDIALTNTMEPLLSQFTSGNGAQNLSNWKSFAATHGITVDKSATDAAQEFKKYASQLISQQRAAMGGNGTDAAQAMAEASSANLGIGNDPNRNILQYIRANAQGMNAFANAKNNYLKGTGQNMVSASDFDNKWNQVYDPRILMFKNMPPDQKQKFVSGLVQSHQYDDFEKKLNGYNTLVNQYAQ